jgi:hypothetical protein
MSTSNGRAKPPRIVAELGRPETPGETAARKAENSRAHRANQTTRNLVLALLASLVLVLFTVLVVVRHNPAPAAPINYRSIAREAQQDITQTVVAPVLPKGWRANDAELKEGNGKSQTWYVGFLTPKQQFIGLEEGIDTTDAWFGSLLGKIKSTGTTTIDGVRWTTYDQRTASDPGNFGYSLSTTLDGARIVLHGTADDREFDELATAVASSLKAPHPQAAK